jgi:predicted TIM-barrel fold metal-dependent hydrolase
VWTDDLKGYPLSPPFTPSDMHPRAADPDDVLDEARRSAVDRVVLIQMSYYGSDNSYMLAVIRRFTGVFRGVAVVDWKGNYPDNEMCELAKHGIRGFRIYAEGQAAAACLASEGLDKMFRCAERERLAMCLLIIPETLVAVAKRCERFPGAPVIIDHLAQIGMDGPILARDVQALCDLSKYPQVKVKVSAFYALGAKRPPHLDLVPLIRRVYDAFGPQRLMWGSDWPVQMAQETYEDSISLVRDQLDFLSHDDKEWLLRKTAESMFFE